MSALVVVAIAYLSYVPGAVCQDVQVVETKITLNGRVLDAYEVDFVPTNPGVERVFTDGSDLFVAGINGQILFQTDQDTHHLIEEIRYFRYSTSRKAVIVRVVLVDDGYECYTKSKGTCWVNNGRLTCI